MPCCRVHQLIKFATLQLTQSYVHVSIIILNIQFPFTQCVFAECNLNYMHLKVIKYMGKKLVNSEKFKCMCINVDSYATAANLAASAIQVLCVCSVFKIVYIF